MRHLPRLRAVFAKCCGSALALALGIGNVVPCTAASIYVNSTSGANNVAGSCVIRDAITAANTAAPVGGCTAGSASGTNVIELPPGGGVVISLTVADNINTTSFGANGLPVVITPIIIHGNGAVVERSLAVACNQDGNLDTGEFRLLSVDLGGSLEIDDATLRNGCADGSSSSAHAGAGGGIDGGYAVLLRRVRLTNNYADLASAISQTSGSLHIEYSTIDHNYTANIGITILAGELSTINSCPAPIDFRLFNSTISDNGPGTFPNILGCGTARIEASTITANEGFPAFQFKSQVGVAAIQIKNSVIADNPGGDCSLPNDSRLSVTGTNLSSDTSCPNFTIISTATLAPLGNYGGPTPTHSPLPASVAIDAVNDCTRVDLSAIVDDQRGVARPQAVRCDIGAVEYNNDLIFANGFE